MTEAGTTTTISKSLRPSERAEFAGIDRLSPDNPISGRQREEQEAYLAETRERLEAERRMFEARLRQIRQEHIDKTVDILLEAGFEEAQGGMSPQRRHRLALHSLASNTVPVDIERGLDAARRRAEQAGDGQTPVLIYAQTGPVNRSGAAPVRRVLMVADVSDIVPTD